MFVLWDYVNLFLLSYSPNNYCRQYHNQLLDTLVLFTKHQTHDNHVAKQYLDQFILVRDLFSLNLCLLLTLTGAYQNVPQETNLQGYVRLSSITGNVGLVPAVSHQPKTNRSNQECFTQSTSTVRQ